MFTHMTNIAFFNSAYSGIAMAITVPTFIAGCAFYIHVKLQNKNEWTRPYNGAPTRTIRGARSKVSPPRCAYPDKKRRAVES